MDSVGLDVLDDDIVVSVKFRSVNREVSSLLHRLHFAHRDWLIDSVSGRLCSNRVIRRLKRGQPRLPHIPP